MKVETCAFSGFKIWPGHGRRIIRVDGKLQIFINKRSLRSAIKLKRNPRDIKWTVLYRRKHKKGIHAEDNTTKKRVKRVVQVASRPVGNITIEAILAKRNEKPEFRRAQREQAVKVAKEAVRAKKAEKKAKAVTVKAAAPKVKAAKQPKAAAPRVGGKR